MNVFQKYTCRCLRRNRSRTVVTIIGIILSMALVTAVIEGAFSGLQYLSRAETARVGAFHAYYFGLNDEQAAQVSAQSGVAATTSWTDVGWAKVDSANEFKPYLSIVSVADDFTDMVAVELLSGRMPENDSELLLPEHLRSNGEVRYAIGDKLTLTVGERTCGGEALSRGIAFQPEAGEEITGGVTKAYTVVGTYARFDTLVEEYECPGYIALTTGAVGTTHTVFFTLKHPGSFFSYMAENAVCEDWVDHRDLLLYSGSVRNSNIAQVLYSLTAILVLLIAFGSISLIYNSFSISVSERTRQFGVLKSVGATRRQIRSTVLYEALLLCAVAIPVGMLVGCLGIGITLWALRDSFNFLLGSGESVKMYLVISPVGLGVSAVVCLLVTLISATIPAKRAIRISAIDAIRQTGDIKIRRRDVRTWALTRKLFGFEGMLASKNFGRNRKRYRSTVVSLMLSITLFISAASLCAYLTDAVGGMSSSQGDSGIDIFYSADGLSAADTERCYTLLSSAPGLTGSAYSRTCYGSVYFAQDILSSEFLGMADTVRFPQEESSWDVTTEVVFMDDDAFRTYCATQGVDPAPYFASPVALACNRMVCRYFENDESKWTSFDALKESTLPVTGQMHTLRTMDGYICADIEDDAYYYYPEDYLNSQTDGNLDRSKAKVLSEQEATQYLPLSVGGFAANRPTLENDASSLLLLYPMSQLSAVVTDAFEDRFDNSRFSFTSDSHKQTYDAMKTLLRENGFATGELYDRAESFESERTMVTVINVFSYGFIILISLIAMANVFNTISTGIHLRRREFAMLKSVGLTGKGFRKMMDFECLRYGAKSILLGLPLALVVTYLIYTATSSAMELSFYIPWYAVAISVGSIFVVVFSTMLYATSKIRHDNPIDALKNENL